jgi:hypothetical protein
VIDRERRAWLRFLIVIAAAAFGETLGFWQGLPFSDSLLPVLFGAGAFYLTMGLTAPRYRSSGNVRYWRGRKIDDD